MLPLLATEYGGLSEAQAGAIFLGSSLVVLVAGPVCGWLSDNVSRRLVLSIRTFVNTISSLLYLFAPGLAGFALGKTLDEVGTAAFRLAWATLMAEIADLDPQHQARTISLMSMGEDGGEVLGPILAGLLWSTGGIGLLLGARIALALITEIYATLLTRSIERRQMEQSALSNQQSALGAVRG
jgi:MFS family permease